MDNQPDQILSHNDKGDDTLRRYDYQKVYTAIVALQLLKQNTSVDEVFCEQFEDVLVKLKNGKFVGIQVKTQELDLGEFNSGDKAIVKSLTRFVELELLFSGCFERYTIATNTGFSKTTNHHKNIHHLIKLAKEGKKEELMKARSLGKKIITQISKSCKCENDVVIDVLSKVSVHSKYASLQKAYLFLNDELSRIEPVKGQTMGVIESVSDRIYSLISKASALTVNGNDVSVFIGTESPENKQNEEIIAGKRIDKKILERIIEDEVAHPVNLYLKDKPKILDIKKTMERLALKMDAGGISSDNVFLAKDYKYSTETHLISWLHKQTPQEADRRYNQVRLAVKTECQEAYDEEKKPDGDFGEEMLKNLRKRLRNRRIDEPDLFFQCGYEHLLGMAGILTEDCEVWWSKKFKIQ